QRRLKLALEDAMPGKPPANLHVNLLAGIVANPLRIDLVVVPAGEGGIVDFHHFIAADLAQLALPADLEPKVAAEDAELDQLADHFLIAPRIDGAVGDLLDLGPRWDEAPVQQRQLALAARAEL